MYLNTQWNFKIPKVCERYVVGLSKNGVKTSNVYNYHHEYIIDLRSVRKKYRQKVFLRDLKAW